MTLKVEILDYSSDPERYKMLLQKIRSWGQRLVFVVDEEADRGILIGGDEAASHAEANRIAAIVERLGE